MGVPNSVGNRARRPEVTASRLVYWGIFGFMENPGKLLVVRISRDIFIEPIQNTARRIHQEFGFLW